MASPDDSLDDIFLPCGRLRTDFLQHDTCRILDDSLQHARDTRWDSVRSPHLFMALLATADPGVIDWGDRLGADLPRLLDQFRDLFYQEEGEVEPFLRLNREFFSDNVIRMLREAVNRCAENDRDQVTPMDLLISLFITPNSIVAHCFEKIGVTAAKLTELAVLSEQQARLNVPPPAQSS
jgi:ATP-dependent Clp protease ATP-binding subunit ClpA